MPRSLALLLIGILLGSGFGYLVGVATAPAPLAGADPMGNAAHDHAAHDHGGGAHAALREADRPAPTLSLQIHPDGARSRNLHLSVTGFTFDPEGVNGPHVAGHGHAHVYVNGIKQARAYGPWVQLYALPEGTHEIRVTLNANDHAQYAVSGRPVEATATLRID